MKITFLGTGTSQGIPMIGSNDPVCLSHNSKDKRLRSSIMISWDDNRYIIDCGPDFRQQMLRENIQAINGVLFTHEHSDHTAGIDDLRPYTYKMGEVPIYAQERVIESLKIRFSYIFETENRYAGAPKLIENIIDSNSFMLNEVQVTPIAVMHGKLPITGYRFGNVAYITDLKTMSDHEKKKLENLDVLIVNALRITAHPTHLNLEEAISFVNEIKPKRAYFTHISHKLGFHEEVEKILPENVFLSYDGLEIKL
ncbi:MBL fold metallo-hydrolase [Flavobacteriaceae bacterium]|jgi:phosphoribosyl 1,2-cyclic phosphate phosphodiesterase|nr:MBL fold metallo-hydrolase [Flavobacteriaceae bacterium]MDB2491286.1 MBL fold metallo-hydrolase [Flavobacteriaceae bacterium]MDB2625488.1 MBL fold metallo-hydrolase [Flavobacteriaceae bacterium]MDB2657985.1 MBL fold metallo-hydrolase [Flavobacteriaceae bacterium]MDB2674660.1 MBL fold metallo-hydrolase [Flavobacteriaceae bacterium]|tara:strand:+ start:2192 stop:2953 length:762 start_codon:yes stop_codon:yes gene_type:complete